MRKCSSLRNLIVIRRIIFRSSRRSWKNHIWRRCLQIPRFTL